MVIIVESKFQGLGGVIVDLAVELLPEGRKEGRKEGRREGDQTQGKRHGPLSLAEGGGGGTQLELHSERKRAPAVDRLNPGPLVAQSHHLGFLLWGQEIRIVPTSTDAAAREGFGVGNP